MAYPTQTVVIRGKTMYAKILGDPVLNYSKDGKEWKTDIVIDKDTVKQLKSLGVGDRVKSKDDYIDGQSYITLKQPELQKSGKANDPIEVVDIKGAAWDQGNLIGNLSDVDVKVNIVDYGVGKKRGIYIKKMRVLNLVPYEKNDFAPITEDDPFFENVKQSNLIDEAQAMFDGGLDDDISDVI